MGVSQEYMLSRIAEVYSVKFARSLNPRQVKPIYISLKCRGMLSGRKKKEKAPEFIQMTIADYMQSEDFK